MGDRLYAFLTEHGILYNDHYGFQTRRSTDLALLRIFNIIHKAWENKQMVTVVMMDLSNASDTLDHNILIS